MNLPILIFVEDVEHLLYLFLLARPIDQENVLNISNIVG